jgi:hypothetical protein
MTDCAAFHRWARSLPRHRFPFDEADIPENGIYILFEKGERAHGGDRIVRVGTHTGGSQLRSRLKQHFITPNKDRSIFRKNIGRALLSHDEDPFLADWEIDLTSRAARKLHSARINCSKQESVENEVSKRIQDIFSFSVVCIDTKEERLRLESRVISTVSLCRSCKPSVDWLGNFSPKEEIRESGLWNVQELYGQPLVGRDFTLLKRAVL